MRTESVGGGGVDLVAVERKDEKILDAVLFGAAATGGAAGAGVYSSSQDVTSGGACLETGAEEGAGEGALDDVFDFEATSVFLFNEALTVFFFFVAAAPFLGVNVLSFFKKAALSDSDLVNKLAFLELIAGILELLATSTGGGESDDEGVVVVDFLAAAPVVTFFFLRISLIV